MNQSSSVSLRCMFVYVYTSPKLDKKKTITLFFATGLFCSAQYFNWLISNSKLTHFDDEVFCLGDEDQIKLNSTDNAAVYAAFSSTSRTSSYMH